MTRPEKRRRVCIEPSALFFKPRGLPLNKLERILLSFDELEAIRLCYHQDLYQDDAAQQMDISRQTLGRILSSANKKIADFLINGKALKIDGGNVKFDIPDKCQNQVKNQGRNNCRRRNK